MESNNNNPGMAEQRRQPRWFGVAATLSVLLHAALFAALAPTRFGTTTSPALLEPAKALVITLRRRTVPEQAADPAPVTPAPRPPPATDAGAAELPAPASPANLPASSSPANASPANLSPINANAAPSSESSATATGDITSNPPGALNATRLAASVRSQMQNHRSAQQVEWMEECQRFRNRYFTQDCTQDPQRRTGSQQLPAALIVPLLDDDSVLGELARERYALVAPARNFSLIPSTQAQLLGPTLNLMDMNGGGLLPALVRSLGLIVTPLPVPDFTRPQPPLASELPQQAPDQDESDTAAFELVSPLFPGNG